MFFVYFRFSNFNYKNNNLSTNNQVVNNILAKEQISKQNINTFLKLFNDLKTIYLDKNNKLDYITYIYNNKELPELILLKEGVIIYNYTYYK